MLSCCSLTLSLPWCNLVSLRGVYQSGCGPADAAVGPFALALKRFGATLKDFPNLAKYVETVGVSHSAALLMKGRALFSIDITEAATPRQYVLVTEHSEAH